MNKRRKYSLNSKQDNFEIAYKIKKTFSQKISQKTYIRYFFIDIILSVKRRIINERKSINPSRGSRFLSQKRT